MKQQHTPISLHGLRPVADHRVTPRADDLPTPQILYSFSGSAPDYGTALASLTQARDGNFYGVTQKTLFSLSPSGTFKTLYTFSGATPTGSVVQAADGNLYGMASFPNQSGVRLHADDVNGGEIYVYNIAHNNIVTTYSLAGFGFPNENLVPDATGNLYGTTRDYLFKLQLATINPPAAGVVTQLYALPDGASTAPVIASDGNIYGASASGCSQTYEIGGVWSYSPATTAYTTIGCFGTSNILGGAAGGLVEASDGNIYGYANAGNGTDSGDEEPDGGFYKVDLATGAISDLYITYYDSSDSSLGTTVISPGGTPYTDNSGNLLLGGYGYADEEYQYGVFLDVTTAGNEYELYDFDANFLTVGYRPAQPVLGNDGNLYVADQFGGDNNPEGAGGTIVRFNTAATPMISLTPSAATVNAGQPFTFTWAALNAFSKSAQACVAFSSDGLFSGSQPYTGSANITPPHDGTHTYSITCGGVETATATVKVVTGSIALSQGGQPLTSASLNLGAVPENGTASTTITLTNNGVTPFPFALSFTGAAASHYSDSTTCSPSIAAGANCTVTFTYQAGASSEVDSAVYTIAKQGFTFTPDNTGTLSARSVTAGDITVSTSSHSFGNVNPGTTYSYTFNVYNGTGGTPTFNQSGSLITGVDSGTVTTTCPSTLAVDETCTVSYSFTPTTAGAYEYDINLSSSAVIQPSSTVKMKATVN